MKRFAVSCLQFTQHKHTAHNQQYEYYKDIQIADQIQQLKFSICMGMKRMPGVTGVLVEGMGMGISVSPYKVTVPVYK